MAKSKVVFEWDEGGNCKVTIPNHSGLTPGMLDRAARVAKTELRRLCYAEGEKVREKNRLAAIEAEKKAKAEAASVAKAEAAAAEARAKELAAAEAKAKAKSKKSGDEAPATS